jgi:molybdopterin converting factor small subunit
MRMQVNLYASFRLHAGLKSFTLDLPDGSTVRQAVLKIVNLYPPLGKDWLDSHGSLHAHVHIIVDGNDISTLPDGYDTRLFAGSELDFFPPVAGGSVRLPG